MDLIHLKRALAAEAQAKGICSEWYNYILRANSKERLLTLFVKGLDFVFDNDFPSAELRAEFKGLYEHYGVFINEPINVAGVRRIVAFGTSEGYANFSGFEVAQIWARDDTKLTVEVKDNTFVCVDITDRAKVEIKASVSAKVTIIQHGGEYINQTSDSAKIKVIDKRK